MSRTIRWIAPLAAVALVLAFSTSRSLAEDAKKDTGKITGTVVDKDGKAIANAEVGVFNVMSKDASKTSVQGHAEGGKAKTEKSISVVPVVKSSEKGEFTLANVPVGDYTVVARLRGQGNARENVTVRAGETAKVELRLVYKAKTPGGAEKPAADKTEPEN